MIKRIIKSVILCLFTLTAFTVVVADEKWQELKEKANKFYQAGNYSIATVWAEEALNYATAHLGKDHPKTLYSMINLAALHNSLGRFDEAELVYLRNLSHRNEVSGEKDPFTLTIMNNLAILYKIQERYDEAELLYLKTLAISNEISGEKHPSTLIFMTNLAHLYKSRGRYDEAEPLFLKTLRLRKEVSGEKHLSTLLIMSNLASLYISQGRYDKAESLYLKVLSYRNEVSGEKDPSTLLIMNNLASLYISQGRYDKAESLYLKVLSYRNEVSGEKDPSTLLIMNNLASLYISQGRYDKAESLYLKVLSYRNEVSGEKDPSTLLIMNNLASLYISQGRYDKAESLYLKVLSYRNEVSGEKDPSTLLIMNNLASLYISQGRDDKAESLYLKVLSYRNEVSGEKHPSTPTSMTKLADLYLYQGRYDEAEPLYLKALELSNEELGENHSDTHASMNNLAALYYHQGRYGEAEPLFLKALALSNEVLGENHPKTFPYMNNLAYLYFLQGRSDKMEAIFDLEFPALQQFLSKMLWNAGAITQESYIKQYITNTDIYLTFFSHHNTDANAHRALQLSLNRKALLLQIAIEVRALESTSGNPALSELVASLKTKRQHLSNLNLKGNPKGVEIDELEEVINQQQAEMGRHVQQLSPDRLSITPNQVIDALGEQSVFIDYMIYQPPALSDEDTDSDVHLLALVVTNDQEHPIRLVPLGEMAPIEQAIRQYRELLSDSLSLTVEGIAIAQQLYQSLWAPLLPKFKQRQQVYIAADGILNLLPFTSLIDSERHYLIEQYKVKMLSTGRDLVVPPLQAQTTDPVIFAAPLYDPEQAEQYASTEDTRKATTIAREKVSLYFEPLPGTLKEGEALIKLLEENEQTANYYKLDKATEENIASVESPRILHIATHGYFLEDIPQPVETELMQPIGEIAVNGELKGLSNVMPRRENPLLRSGLALVDANLAIKTDNEVQHGILTALEVLDLQLAGTELVVLSACDTGAGEIRTGEGIYGLRRAFQEAGAHYVLSTLWSISDDGTQEFMKRFYQRYLADTPPQQALRDTQLEFIQSKKWSHPYYWAAFVIMGK